LRRPRRTLGVVDDDTVSLSNLQRRYPRHARHRLRKVDSAEAAIARSIRSRDRDPHDAADASNALDLISKYDIVADGSDNFATRYLVSTRVINQEPLVTAAVGTSDGSLTTLRAHETRDWRAQSDLPLVCSGAAAARHGARTCARAGTPGRLAGHLF